MGESIMSRYPVGQRAVMKEVYKTEIIVQNKLWEVPNNCNVSRGISVRIFGGGGIGRGGGGGWMNNAIFTNLTKGQLISVIIGEGGGRNSNYGGTTFFGNYLSANGGQGGSHTTCDGGSGGGSCWSYTDNGVWRFCGGKGYQFGGGGGRAIYNSKSQSWSIGNGGDGGIWGGGGGGGCWILTWDGYDDIALMNGGVGGNGGIYGGNGGNGGVSGIINIYGSSNNNYYTHPTPAEDGTVIESQTLEDGTALVTTGKSGIFTNNGYINNGYGNRYYYYHISGPGGGGYGGCGGYGIGCLIQHNSHKNYTLPSGGGGGGYGCNGGNGGLSGWQGGGGGGYGCDGADADNGGGGGGYGKAGYGHGGGGSPNVESNSYGMHGVCIIQYYNNELTLL